MKLKLVLSLILLFTISLCGPAADSPGNTPQKTSCKTPKLGLIFKANALGNVGLLFHLSDKLSLRTTLGYGSIKDDTAIESAHIFSATQKRSETELGVGLLYNLKKTDKHAIYLGMEAGMQYYWANYTQTYKTPPYAAQTTDTEKFDSFGYHVDALFGVRHAFSPKFAVYGEVSLGFTHLNVGSTDNDRMEWDLKRSGVGVIFSL